MTDDVKWGSWESFKKWEVVAGELTPVVWQRRNGLTMKRDGATVAYQLLVETRRKPIEDSAEGRVRRWWDLRHRRPLLPSLHPLRKAHRSSPQAEDQDVSGLPTGGPEDVEGEPQ